MAVNIVAEFFAVLACALFCGGAMYVSFVEHPARMACGTELAVMEFIPSYRLGTIMQASLALFGSLCSVAAWLLGSSSWWPMTAAPLALVIPFSLFIIFPTNQQLVDPALDRRSETAHALLSSWGKLHAIRGALSLVSLIGFLVLLLRTT